MTKIIHSLEYKETYDQVLELLEDMVIYRFQHQEVKGIDDCENLSRLYQEHTKVENLIEANFDNPTLTSVYWETTNE